MHIHDEWCFVVHAQHLTLVPMVVVFLLQSTWPPVLSGHNFLVHHPRHPLAPFRSLWYCPDLKERSFSNPFSKTEARGRMESDAEIVKGNPTSNVPLLSTAQSREPLPPPPNFGGSSDPRPPQMNFSPALPINQPDFTPSR